MAIGGGQPLGLVSIVILMRAVYVLIVNREWYYVNSIM